MNMPLRYLSVCSGIEAASVAWEPLGWRPVAFSEIDAFPSAVLAHHYPTVPNWGDMTRFKEWPDAAVDLLVGGTPCQSFSVAGLRKGLDDPRGNLALVYLGLVDRYRPKWVVWENVPGVLSSSKGRDFGAFLGGLGELGYGWAYRVLDAQYIRTRRFSGAVPQRRRRVFVVGYLGDWRPPAAVLIEPESLSGHPAPRREARERVAPTISARPTGGGGLGTDFDLDGGLIANSGEVGYCLTASAQQSLDAETETLIAVAHALRGEGFDASEDGTGRGTLLVPVAFPLTAGMSKSAARMPQEQGALLPVAFDSKGTQVQVDLTGATPTLRAMGHSGSHANAGGQLAVAFDAQAGGNTGLAIGEEVAGALHGGGSHGGRAAVATRWAVRRLTPLECERLQGFPDNYTDVPYRNRNGTPDGPRYKALGNSMAVNAMDWIGQRIEYVRTILAEQGWKS